MKRTLLLALILTGCSSGPSPVGEGVRIKMQLDELYRPLAALVEESRLSVQDFLKKEGRIQIMPTDRTLTDEELKRWIEKAEKDLLPRNDKMCALIRAKQELVEGGTLPKSWQALLEHQDGWREDHDKWRKEGVAYPFHARTSFPRTLEKELKASIASLEERRAALLKN
jgi:hypothetical protein